MSQADLPFLGSRIVVNGTSALAVEIASYFTAAGASVVDAVSDSRRENGEAVSVDIATPAGVNAFAEQALRRLGDIDVIVNVASPNGSAAARYSELTDEDVRRDINTTFMSALRLDRALTPGMIERQVGVIVHVTSGESGTAGQKALTLTPMEAALASYSKSLAKHLGPYGIRVNVVIAGMLESTPTEEGAASIPLGRNGELHEVAELVAFLASSKASYITGAQYIIDGGQHRAIQI